MIRLFIVRHGSTAELARDMVQGQSGGPLNDLGREQALETARVLNHIPFSVFYSSDLQRAVETAQIIIDSEAHQLQQLAILREISCGVLEGRARNELKEDYERSAQSLEEYRPEGGESLLELRSRVSGFIDLLREKHRGNNVFVCSHLGFIQSLIGYCSDRSPAQSLEIRIAPGTISLVSIFERQLAVVAQGLAPEIFKDLKIDV